MVFILWLRTRSNRANRKYVTCCVVCVCVLYVSGQPLKLTDPIAYWLAVEHVLNCIRRCSCESSSNSSNSYSKRLKPQRDNHNLVNRLTFIYLINHAIESPEKCTHRIYRIIGCCVCARARARNDNDASFGKNNKINGL